MNSFIVGGLFVIFIAELVLLQNMAKRHISYSKRVFYALGLAILTGILFQILGGGESQSIQFVVNWIKLPGTAYVRLLKMIIYPLILVSIISAIMNLEDQGSLKKTSSSVIGFLVGTTAIAAIVGASTALLFKLSAQGIVPNSAQAARGAALESRLESVQSQPIVDRLVAMIPTNPFLDLTGARSSSTIATVIFASFIGLAILGLKRKKPESAAFSIKLIEAAHDVVMRVVTLVLRLTPYGILALMTKVVGTTKLSEVLELVKFLGASYFAIIVMFIIHLILISSVKLNPLTYLRKSLPTLSFAFTSRTSAGTLPMTTQTLEKGFGVSRGVANMAASLGVSIGQNGCAGIYPAMLAIMVAPTVGINPLSPVFLLQLIFIVSISSFGVAGVGGGATFAALIVLSAMDLPVALVGLLISIEPLIDMARTALNVSGAMVTGILTGQKTGNLEKSIYNQSHFELDEESTS